MCLYSCVYVYIYICVCLYVSMFECMYVRMNECLYEWMYVCMYVFMYKCMNEGMYVRMCLYSCVYVYMSVMYVCMYVCMFIYLRQVESMGPWNSTPTPLDGTESSELQRWHFLLLVKPVSRYHASVCRLGDTWTAGSWLSSNLVPSMKPYFDAMNRRLPYQEREWSVGRNMLLMALGRTWTITNKKHFTQTLRFANIQFQMPTYIYIYIYVHIFENILKKNK